MTFPGLHSILEILVFIVMEDLTPFNRCIKLDPGARKLILDMIRSIKSLIPDDPALVPSPGYADSPFIEEFVREVLKAAENNYALLTDIADPGSLENLLRHAGDLQEVGDQIEKLLHAVRNYQNLASFLSYKQADLVKEHLELIAPDSCREADQVAQKMKKKNLSNQTSRKKNIKLKVV